MPNVTFHGGPCAHETHAYTAAALADGKVTCQGTVYDTFDNHAGGYFAVPESQLAPTVPVPPLHDAAHSWKRLVQGMAVTAPAFLREAGKHRRAMLRIGRR